MVRITEGGDEHYSDARGAGRNPNVDAKGQRTGRGQAELPEMFQNTAVDKALGKLGGDPERVIKALRRDLDKLPPKQRDKAVRAIRTRAVKRGQGRRGRRGRGDGGTPMIDSKRY